MVSIITPHCIVCRDKGTYRSRTRCVSGPPRAADLSAVAEGCSHAMVGAQLWLWRRTAARKATTAMSWVCIEICGQGGRCYNIIARLTLQAGPQHKIWSTDAPPMVFPVQLSTRFPHDPLLMPICPTQPPPSCTRLEWCFSISARFDVREFSVRPSPVCFSAFSEYVKTRFFETGLIIGLDPLTTSRAVHRTLTDGYSIEVR